MPFDTIVDAIEDIKNGKIVIVVDDQFQRSVGAEIPSALHTPVRGADGRPAAAGSVDAGVVFRAWGTADAFAATEAFDTPSIK